MFKNTGDGYIRHLSYPYKRSYSAGIFQSAKEMLVSLDTQMIALASHKATWPYPIVFIFKKIFYVWPFHKQILPKK